MVIFFRWSLICLLRRANRMRCVRCFLQKEIRRLVEISCSLDFAICALIHRTLSWGDTSGGSEIFVAAHLRPVFESVNIMRRILELGSLLVALSLIMTLARGDTSGGFEIFVACSERELEGGKSLRGGRSAVFGEGQLLFLEGFLV